MVENGLDEQAAAMQAQQQQMQLQQQNYNSESDEDQYEVDGFSDEIAFQNNNNGWIKWFCQLDGHEFLVEVDNDFIQDPFNLQGLQEKFSRDKMKACLQMILSPIQPSEENLQEEEFLELNQESSDLYSLIHARYVQTAKGLAKVYQKYLSGVYGTCPRALCDRQKVLPVGLSDSLKTSRFKNFCPRCEEVYLPKSRQVNVDGASFGTSFPQVFQMHYPLAVILPPKIYHYEPKIYGFKIAGKRGSKYFKPPQGNVRYIEDSVSGLELEDVEKRAAQTGEQVAIDFNRKMVIAGDGSNAAKGAAASSTGEDNEAQVIGGGSGSQNEANRQGGGKKSRKKNKK